MYKSLHGKMATNTHGISYWTKRRRIQKNVDEHFTTVEEEVAHVGLGYISRELKGCIDTNSTEAIVPNVQNDGICTVYKYNVGQVVYSTDSNLSDSDSNDDAESITTMDTDTDHNPLPEQLRMWASTHNIPMSSLTALLMRWVRTNC